MKNLRFNDALRLAAESTVAKEAQTEWPVLLIRDIYGRLRFAVNAEKSAYPEHARQYLEASTKTLGAFASPGGIIFRDDFTNPDALFDHEDWHETLVPGVEGEDGRVFPEIAVALLDRQIIGQDWLHTVRDPEEGTPPPRVVFYGVKGGVGRSTALAMLAYRLAGDGKRVLLLDFDLESPGLSGLLLPPERVATYGLVDWFIEDGVGQGETVLDDIISDSPLADFTTGAIRIASAMGRDESAYLAKLARVYADVPRANGPERFATRMQRVVRELEVREKPDVVVIDSRAGLHDLAAISIAGLADVSLLFATDSAQSWQGYRQLFEHWRQRPDVLRLVRKRLAIVQALFPESDQEYRARRFLERAYDLFRENLYDSIDPGTEELPDAFTFDLESESAPHFPLRVRWSARFQEFDPLIPIEKGGLDDADIDLAFGPFVRDIKSMIFEGNE